MKKRRYFDGRAGGCRISAIMWWVGSIAVHVIQGNDSPLSYFFLGVAGLYMVAAEIVAAIEEQP